MSKTSYFSFGIAAFCTLLFSTVLAEADQGPAQPTQPRKQKFTDLHFEKTPFVELLRDLSESTEWMDAGKAERGLPKLSIVYDASIADDAYLTMNARNLSPFAAIQLAAEMVGAEYQLIENCIYLSSKRGAQENGTPFSIRIEPQSDNADLAIIAVTNQPAFHGVQLVYLEGSADLRLDLCIIVSPEMKKWGAVAFRDGIIENIGALQPNELATITKVLGNPSREILSNPRARIEVDIQFDERSDTFSYSHGRQKALHGIDGESFHCVYAQWKGGDHNDVSERIVLSVGLDSLVVSKENPGGTVSSLNVLCFDHRTKMPLGENYQFTRNGHRIWIVGPVFDQKHVK